MLYRLTGFELINQLLYINSPNLERKIFLKDLKSTRGGGATASEGQVYMRPPFIGRIANF